MKKILLLLVLSLSTASFAQQQDAWVYFNSKSDVQYFYFNPLQMLSQRALDRRAKQNISLDDKDIPISKSIIDQIKAAPGITVKAKSKWLNALHIRGTVTAINSLTSLSFVNKVVFANKTLNAKPAGKMAQQQQLPAVNKTLETQTFYNYGTSANQIQMLKGDKLHQQNYTGAGKIIAVLDGGFPGVDVVSPFSKLRYNHQILGGYNYVARNNDIYSSSSHGTSVLSTMGGFADGQLVGTAPDASYYLFITEDDNSENPVEESNWVEAAEAADSLGVDVINTSLGYFTYDNPNYSYTYGDMDGKTSFVSRGADIAFSRGIFVVVSAGNEGNTSNPHIGVPADAFNVLTVGAVTHDGLYISFSSIGNTSDGRVKPDVMARGVGSVVSDSSGSIVSLNGTSFASPITAGLVACLWQALPDVTNAHLLQLIKQSSSLYNNPTIYMGYGIPDFSVALNNVLAVNEIVKDPVGLYPNPVTDKLYLNSSAEIGNSTIYIYSALGQKVLEKKYTSETDSIDLESLNPGVYLYKIQSDSYSQSGKIIKK